MTASPLLDAAYGPRGRLAPIAGRTRCPHPATLALRYEPRLTGLPGGAPVELCAAHAGDRRARQDPFGLWVVVAAWAGTALGPRSAAEPQGQQA